MKGRVDPLIGLTVGGRYVIQAPLGQGGVARVYRAVQEPMGRAVALKLVRPDLEGERRDAFQARFLREAALAGRMQHPNLVRVYDYGRDEDDDSCFIVMELLQGLSLKRRMIGPLDPDWSARIAAELARGLFHAHARGVVHRDVKPSNVLIVRDDQGQEHPKLIDFGLVRGEDDEQSDTGAGTFLGTPHYVAPEQARAEGELDGRADQYALGVVLYRMLTGVLPFEAEHPMAIALQHVRSPYPPMPERAPEVEVDAALEAIVRRAMAKDPKERWPDCSEMALALESWRDTLEPLMTDEEPLPPAPPKRSGAGMLALGTLLGLGAVGGGAALWMSQRAPRSPVAEHPALAEPDLSPVEEFEEPADGVKAVRVETKVQKVRSANPAPEVSSGPRAYDEVFMTGAEAAAALRWVNTASEQELRAGGLYGRGVNTVLEKRPFPSMEAFAATPYIGEKTVRAALEATR